MLTLIKTIFDYLINVYNTMVTKKYFRLTLTIIILTTFFLVYNNNFEHFLIWARLNIFSIKLLNLIFKSNFSFIRTKKQYSFLFFLYNKFFNKKDDSSKDDLSKETYPQKTIYKKNAFKKTTEDIFVNLFEFEDKIIQYNYSEFKEKTKVQDSIEKIIENFDSKFENFKSVGSKIKFVKSSMRQIDYLNSLIIPGNDDDITTLLTHHNSLKAIIAKDALLSANEKENLLKVIGLIISSKKTTIEKFNEINDNEISEKIGLKLANYYFDNKEFKFNKFKNKYVAPKSKYIIGSIIFEPLSRKKIDEYNYRVDKFLTLQKHIKRYVEIKDELD